MSLRIPRENVIILSLFVILTFALNWKIFLSPLSHTPTTQLLNGIGNNLGLALPTLLSGYYSFPGLGSPNSVAYPDLPWFVPLYLLFSITKMANLAYRLWLFVMYIVMLYGTYHFLKKVLGVNSLPSLLGTLFLIFMPLNINAIAQAGPIVYIGIPAFLAAIYYMVRLMNRLNALHLIGFLVSTFIVGSFPPFYLLEVIATILYFPFTITWSAVTQSLRTGFVKVLSLLMGSVLAVGYYAVPSIINILSGIRTGFYYALSKNQAVSTLISQKGYYFPPNNYFGMDYGYVMFHNIAGYVSIPLKDLTINVGYLLLPVAIPVCLTCLFLGSSKEKRLALYFSIVYLTGVSLFAGANFPSLLLFLMETFPIPFAVLRSSLNAYPLVYVPLAAMASLTCEHSIRMFRRCRSFAKKTIVLIMILLLCTIPIYSIISLAPSGDFLGTSPSVELPSDYQYVSNYVLSQTATEPFRIAVPGLKGIYRTYWAPNNFWEGSPFLSYGVPVIYELYIQPAPLVAQAAFSILDSMPRAPPNEAEQRALGILLGLMNVKYVLVQCDVEGMCSNPAFSKAAMITKLGNTSIVRFENITLYSNPRFYPLAYVPDSLVLVSNETTSWISAAGESNMNQYVSFTSNVSVFSLLKHYSAQLVNNNTLLLHTARILNITANPPYSRFRFQIDTTEQPFVLIVSNTFDPNFQASVDRGSIIAHFEVNSFANAWLVSPNDKHVEITISYQQNLLLFYLLLAFFILIILLSIIHYWPSLRRSWLRNIHKIFRDS